MLLAKSCERAYNVKNGTLKLGSLHEYRETEKEQIADKEEGLLRYNIKFDGDVKIPNRIFNTLSGGAMQSGRQQGVRFPGTSDLHIDHLQIVEADGEHTTLRNSTAKVVRAAPNCFIYCMSKVRRMRDAYDIFPDYDDSWYIREQNTLKFAVAIGKELLNTIRHEHTQGNFITPKEIDPRKLKVYLNHGEILYTDRELHITNQNILLLEEFFEKMNTMAFIKPPIPFIKEKEYRFQYTIMADGYTIPPLKNSMIISSETLQNFVI